MPSPSTWTPTGLLDYFREVDQTDDRRFAFILGAGASVQSGIPMAGQLVATWLRELHAREDHERRPLAEWATPERLGIPGFVLERAVEWYPQLFARRFEDRPEEGHAYLERILHGRDPSFGYSVLAQVLANTRHRVVITTNFDNLIADALAIYTDKLPFVCGHESLTGFVHVNPRRPLVIKVHRDLLMAPKNSSDEIAALPEPLIGSLRELLKNYTPIVIGYGGNDGSLMGLLRDTLQPGDIPGGIYWCYWKGGGPPGGAVAEVVTRHRGRMVPIEGFDELMAMLNHRLGYPRMDQRIEQRARERAQQYRQSFEALHQRVFPPPEPPAVAEEAEASADAVASAAGDAPRTTPLPPPATAPAEPSRPTRSGGPLGPVLSGRSPSRSAEPVAGDRKRSAGASERALETLLGDDPSAAETRRGDDKPAEALRGPARGDEPSAAGTLRSPARGDDKSAEAPRGPARDDGPSVIETLRGPTRGDDPALFAGVHPGPASTPSSQSLQQAVQSLASEEPGGADWWTLKLQADGLETHEQRIAAYHEALARFPNQSELHLGLARTLALANRPGEARRKYQAIEQSTPDDPQLHIDLAVLYPHWGSAPRAREHAVRAWRLASPDDPGTQAAAAFLRGLLDRRDDLDDTVALRVLRGLLPVRTAPLGWCLGILRQRVNRLDGPAQALYFRLLMVLCGFAEAQTLGAIDRWNQLTPLAPAAAWSDSTAAF